MDNYYGNICYCRRCNGVVHTIKKGDTLYLISKYYKVPIGEIMGANRNINIYNLQIGDEICIPVRRPEAVNPENNSQSMIMPRDNAPENRNMMNPIDMMNPMDMMTDETAEMSSESVDSSVPENETQAGDIVMASAAMSDSEIKNMKVSDILETGDMTVSQLAEILKKIM